MAKRARPARSTPMLEWIAASLGLLVALFLLGAIGWQALAGQDDPVPLLEARLESVTPAGPVFVATIRVVNQSSRTAASVQVEGVLGKGATDEERSSASIDFVPGHGAASGALMFSADPRRRPLELRVTGYEHP